MKLEARGKVQQPSLEAQPHLMLPSLGDCVSNLMLMSLVRSDILFVGSRMSKHRAHSGPHFLGDDGDIFEVERMRICEDVPYDFA